MWIPRWVELSDANGVDSVELDWTGPGFGWTGLGLAGALWTGYGLRWAPGAPAAKPSSV